MFQHGLIAPSFVPTQQMRHLRDLTRTRTKVTQDHTRVVDRIEAVLEDTSIKLSSVVSDIMVVSAQAMLQAFAAWRGTRRNSRELTQGRMRPKVPQLKEALEGNLRPHHEFVRNDCSMPPRFLQQQQRALSREIEHRLDDDMQQAIALWDTIPGRG